MTVFFQFSGASCAGLDSPRAFALEAGEIRVLRVASGTEKAAVIDALVGNGACAEEAVLLEGVPLGDCKPGSVGWVAADGGLVSNLKVWENVTLPLWYHGRHVADEAEQAIACWLSALAMAESEWAAFMASPPDRLLAWQRKLAGLLRALVQDPPVLVVDAALFDGVEPNRGALWSGALQAYAERGRAVLVVAVGERALPWKIIE